MRITALNKKTTPNSVQKTVNSTTQKTVLCSKETMQNRVIIMGTGVTKKDKPPITAKYDVSKNKL